MTLLAAAMPANAAVGTTYQFQQPVVIASLNPGVIYANSLYVDLSVNPVSVDVNSPIAVSASARYYNGTPAVGATITLTCNPVAGGTFEKSSYTTTSLLKVGGGYSYLNTLATTFHASVPGSYKITATVTKSGFTTGTNSSTVTVTSPPTPTPGTSTPVPPVVTPVQQQVTATATPQALSVTPGAVSVVATPTQIPTNTTAVVAGDSGMGGLTAYLPYIAGAIILILLILIVVLYLWTKKTLKVVPKADSAPCDGKSEIPIKVMFVNGFGNSRKPGSDIEVDMKSTAGSIKNAVLPSSRDFVEATLIAPREFGQATVSASANSKTANAVVNFNYKHASFDVTVTPDSIPSDGRSSANVKLQIKDENGNVIAPIVERTVELKTTLGSITSLVKIPSKATEANATITAGEVSGTAVIYAVSGDIKGEGKVSFKGLPKRFCMHCGTRMDMDAASCPKCGLTPPSGVDTKACPTCSTVIPEAAKYCYNCGARQNETKPQ
jgi:RNA polymerase subunit RPABC4/transcription elongation factor Spt4